MDMLEIPPENFFKTFLSLFDFSPEKREEMLDIFVNAHKKLMMLAKEEKCPKAFMWFQIGLDDYAAFRVDVDDVENPDSSKIFNCALRHLERYQSIYVVLDKEMEVPDIITHNKVIDVSSLVFKDNLH